MSIGSRLSNNIIGSKSELFCQKAHKIIVDIDSEELKKPTISGWHNSKSTTLINTSVEKLCAEIQNFNSNKRNITHKKDNSSWSNLSDKDNADKFEYSNIHRH